MRAHRPAMSRPLPLALLVPLLAGLCGAVAAALAAGAGGDAVRSAVDAWFQPAGFLACGAATLLAARRTRGERLPWALLGTGLVVYAAGSVIFNLQAGDGSSAPFPSTADAAWLAMYPLALVAVVRLALRRFPGLPAQAWLDGAIGSLVVVALAAATLFEPGLDLGGASGTAALAQLAYPLGDLVLVGFTCVLWSLTGFRLWSCWSLLVVGFTLLAVGDSTYVVAAGNGEWTAGIVSGLPYVAGTATLAIAAWTTARHPITDAGASTPVVLPVAAALLAVGLTATAALGALDPLASALALATLLAVVVRFGVTLASLTRQRVALASLAWSDALTGLTNHRRFHELLSQAVAASRASGSPLSVVTLDVDHFKAVNDTYGHAAGDEALAAIAAQLGHQVRGGDVVGRIGGEEFALLLPGADGDQAEAVAERCRLAVSTIVVHGEALSCSAGVASFPGDDPDGGRLLELADGALYWAKRAGRAQVRRYDPREVVTMSHAEQRAEVQALLDRADALTPVFQPIVELATGRVAGFEALTRFTGTEPARPPDQWFAQARRCGLGPALEARAIARALAVPGRPAGAYLAVNLSPSALVSTEVAAVLPHDLTGLLIELTEDALFASDPALDAALDGLRSRGARIAVDDAGAGYSGLQQLLRVKPDVLKLDRSLIEGIVDDESKIALLDALARFATSTGAAVCAEGIEQLDELRLLTRFDVTYGQGYGLGRPGPPWPDVVAGAAAAAAAEVRWGMRVVPSADDEGRGTMGDVSEHLSHVRTRAQLDRVLGRIERLLHADDIAVSRVLADERCVETISTHESEPGGPQRFAFDDYATTERVIVHQVVGQVVVDDPAADTAEAALLRQVGFAAVLLAPIVCRGETVGLLEFYRREARPWTGTEVDQARVLANQLSGLVTGAHLDAPVRDAAA